jgi:hypothetical protein
MMMKRRSFLAALPAALSGRQASAAPMGFPKITLAGGGKYSRVQITKLIDDINGATIGRVR